MVLDSLVLCCSSLPTFPVLLLDQLLCFFSPRKYVDRLIRDLLRRATASGNNFRVAVARCQVVRDDQGVQRSCSWKYPRDRFVAQKWPPFWRHVRAEYESCQQTPWELLVGSMTYERREGVPDAVKVMISWSYSNRCKRSLANAGDPDEWRGSLSDAGSPSHHKVRHSHFDFPYQEAERVLHCPIYDALRIKKNKHRNSFPQMMLPCMPSSHVHRPKVAVEIRDEKKSRTTGEGKQDRDTFIDEGTDKIEMISRLDRRWIYTKLGSVAPNDCLPGPANRIRGG